MTWFGGPEYLGIAIWDAAVIVCGIVAVRVQRWRRHHRVPHYKLRATNLLHQQGDVPEVALGSTAPSVEPQPAPTVPTDPGAGTNLQSGLSRLEQGRRRDHSSEPPQPAPGAHPGAGPTPPRTSLAAGHEEDRDADTTPSRASVSASPHQRPVAVCPPERAAAGLPTPEPGAPAWVRS